MDQTSTNTEHTNRDSLLPILQKVWRVLIAAWRWAAYAIGSLVLVVLIIAVLIGRLLGPSQQGGYAEQFISGSGIDKIVVINVSGIIGAAATPIGSASGVSTDQIRQQLRQAADDPLVKAVILHIDSPGGSAVVSDQIWQTVTDFKKEHHIPVVAQFGDTAASGGYYIATAADKIVANAASLTGSIGVIMEFYDASGLLNKIGVSADVVKSGPYKDIGSLTRPATPDERAILQSVVNDAYVQFVQRVADGRKLDVEKIRQLGDGRVYTGVQAKENGLVDELGNLDEAVSEAKSLADISSATVVEYGQSNLLQSLLSGYASTSLSSQLMSLSGRSGAPTTGLQYIWRP
jgi:protease-4